MLQGVNRIALHLIEDLIRPISGPLGVRLRRAYYRRRLKICGTNLVIAPGVTIDNPEYVSLGDWVWLDRNVTIIAGLALPVSEVKSIDNPNCLARPGEVIIGDRCHISLGCVIQGHGGVWIGDGFACGTNSLIYSLSNSLYSTNMGPIVSAGSPMARVATPVAIMGNVWLGMNTIVIGGTIGQDSFVRPFSVVTSAIPSNSIAAGHPARCERERYRDREA